jgi:hypothetical protein
VPVWPRRKDTVRNDYTFPKPFYQWTLNAETVQFRLQFLTFRFNSPACSTTPEPIKEDSPLTRESQQRLPPPTMKIPPVSKAQRPRSLPHPDLRGCETTPQIHGTLFLPVRASSDPFSLKRSPSSRYEQAVQRLSTTMKTVAKGILKDHLVPVASNMTCFGNLNGFNNVGYKATFRPLKVQVPLTESTLFTPMKCLRRVQRDAILIHWDVWSHHVREASMQYLTLNYPLRSCDENQLKRQQGVW